MTKLHLVTGATGATGGDAVDNLLKAGESVRAFVHSDGPKADALRARGVDVVTGDLLDIDAVSRAMRDVESAYFVYPIMPGLMSATAKFAHIARSHGVKAIVNMSQISAREQADSVGAREHWLAERVFDWSGVPVTHLRPTFFAEWLLYAAPGIKAGTLKTPMSTGRHAPIAAADQARVIAAILIDPRPHADRIYNLYGPTEYNHDEIARIVGSTLGKSVVHQHVPVEEFGKMIGAPAQSTNEQGAPWSKAEILTGRSGAWYLLQHLHEVARDHTSGIFAGTNSVIEDITGEPPMSLAKFIESHKQSLI